MKKTVVILVISLHVIISASEFSDNEKLTGMFCELICDYFH